MTDHSPAQGSITAARFAGLGYVLTTILGLFYAMYVAGLTVVWDDAAATAHNIQANEFLFRCAIVAELLMAAGVVVMAAGLYLALKQVNKGLALVAAFWRLGEATVVAVFVLMKFAALDVLTGGKALAAFDTAQLENFALLFIHLHGLSIYIVILFMGLGGVIFCYLLFAGRYIPRILSIWGMLTYTQMVLGSGFVILFPQYWKWVQLSFAPGALFELLLGLWLLIAGIKLPSTDKEGR